MKTLDIRRHSLRKDGGGSQLSQAGVDLARRIGATLGPYAQVVTTPVPRTRETAIAMGFAVDYELLMPSWAVSIYRCQIVARLFQYAIRSAAKPRSCASCSATNPSSTCALHPTPVLMKRIFG